MQLKNKIFLIGLMGLLIFLIWSVTSLRKMAKDVRDYQKSFLTSSVPRNSSSSDIATSKEKSSDLLRGSEVEGKIVTSSPSPIAEPSPIPEPPYTFATLVEDLNSKSVVAVCDFFGTESGLRIFKNMQKRPSLMDSILSTGGMLDVGLLSYRLPVNQALVLRLEEQPSLLNDLSFAFEIFKAKVELQKNLGLAKQVEVQSYYANILAKIVSKNPNLLEDANIRQLCGRLTNIKEPLSQEAMNAEVLGFMQRAQVKPEEVNFKPDYSPTVQLLQHTSGHWEYIVKNRF